MTLILPSAKDAAHKAGMFRVLRALADDARLANDLVFKGGTCAAMRGFLDRFSVDLDFDYVVGADEMPATRTRLERLFVDLGLEVRDASTEVPQYFLKYPVKDGERNTLKFEATTLMSVADKREKVRLADIDRVLACHTIETMFAHKLVALMDRYERHGSIAGRDVYDIHHFFLAGFSYDPAVIEDRRRVPARAYLKDLRAFVLRNVTDTVINQDLNTLLSRDQFQKIRHVLKEETIMFLDDEMRRLS